MNKKNGLTILLAALIAISIVGCGKEDNKGIVKVNGVSISNTELLEYLETKNTVRVQLNGQVGNAQVADTLAFQALQDLVVRKLILQMAKSEGVLPDKNAIENEIKLRDEISPNFLKTLQSGGLSLKAIREQIEADLAQQNIYSKGIEVTDQEVDDYIKAKPQEFEEPAKAEMYWIVASDANKAPVDSELSKGKKFQDVAVEFSLDQTAKTSGGKFNARAYPSGVPLVTLAPEIRTMIEATEAGKATSWVKLPTQQGQAPMSAKFFVIRKTDARKIEITDARKAWVKKQLAVSRGKQTKDLQEKLVEMMKEAKIEVTDKTLKTFWEKFEETLKANAESTTVPNSDGETEPATN